MKRSVSLVLLFAACVVALSLLTTLTGCSAGKLETPDDLKTPVDDPPVAAGETTAYTSGYVDLALTLPEGWQWESVQDKSAKTEGIRFWKTDDSTVKFLLQCWTRGYGLCGTGLVSEELTLSNGQQVWQHTYEQDAFWVNLYFSDVPGDYVLEPDGEMSETTWNACREELLAILATAQFGRNAPMTEQEAIDAAKPLCDGDYEMAYGRYDVTTGCWTVIFSKSAVGQNSLRFTVSPQGNVTPLEDM